MKRFNSFGVAIFASFGAIMSEPASAQSVVVDYALKYCRSIPDATTRVECYDKVVDEASAKETAAPAGARVGAALAPRVGVQLSSAP
ncbi:MAG TPA: hypothetical protein VNH64_03415, partial [Parvularculaceae bacterium]|nr:hypothetical protein [Parvularculaceae bacterium]